MIDDQDNQGFRDHIRLVIWLWTMVWVWFCQMNGVYLLISLEMGDTPMKMFSLSCIERLVLTHTG